MKLDGKTAVITGAGCGIGREIALELAKEGANIVLAAPELDQIEAVATKGRSDNHLDDQSKLLQPEDIAEYVAFILTRPDRAFIVEATIIPQATKPVPNPSNFNAGIKAANR